MKRVFVPFSSNKSQFQDFLFFSVCSKRYIFAPHTDMVEQHTVESCARRHLHCVFMLFLNVPETFQLEQKSAPTCYTLCQMNRQKCIDLRVWKEDSDTCLGH